MPLFPLLEQLLQALGRRYTPAMQQAAAAQGVNSGLSLLFAARSLEPDPISAARLLMRNPYWTEAVYQEGLTTLARLDALEPSARRSFRLTPKGRLVLEEAVWAVMSVLSELEPLPPAELERAAGLLWSLVDASLHAPRPRRKWSLERSRRDDAPELPVAEQTALVRIDQYLSDLHAFRDDCHLDAWRGTGISGPAWEAFTLVWRGQAATLDEIEQAMARRRAPVGTYEAAIQALLYKGWVRQKDGHILVTPEGDALRQHAEEETDSLFYAPWAVLTEKQTAVLQQLVEQMVTALE